MLTCLTTMENQIGYLKKKKRFEVGKRKVTILHTFSSIITHINSLH